jgi:hypothetical protein
MQEPAVSEYLMMLVAAIGVLGCRNSSSPSFPICSESVTLTASTSLPATFSWTPNCLIDHLLVEEPLAPSVGAFHFLWQIVARSEGQGAASPLRYGRVPSGMQELIPAEPLLTGHSYWVRVYGKNAIVGEVRLFY